MNQETNRPEIVYGANEQISREFMERVEKERKSLGGSSEAMGQAGCALFFIFAVVVCALLYFLTPKTPKTARGTFERMVNKVSETTKEWFFDHKTTSLDYEIPKIQKGYLLVANSTDKEMFDVAFEVNDGTWCAKKEFGVATVSVSEKGKEDCDGTRLVTLNNKEKKYLTVDMVTGEISHPTTGDDTADNAKKGTYKTYALNYIKNIELAIMEASMQNIDSDTFDGIFDGKVLNLEDGSEVPLTVSTSGKNPANISIVIKNVNG